MGKINGNTSDGYHTFNELYHHRAVLFASLLKAYPDISWKSKFHSDGSMYKGYFVAGIHTPEGEYTYHFDISEWDILSCTELKNAPKWDGHLPKDVDRLLSLEPLVFDIVNRGKVKTRYSFEEEYDMSYLQSSKAIQVYNPVKATNRGKGIPIYKKYD